MSPRKFGPVALLALAGVGCSSAIGALDATVDDRTAAVESGVADAGPDVARPDVGLDAVAVDVAMDVPQPRDTGATDGVGGPDVPVVGRDGSILPPADAGDPFGDAGPLGEPAWAPIDVRTTGMCDPLVPCGGDVVGTWDVSGGCVEVPIGMGLAACPGAAITHSTGRGRGRVVFDGTTAHRVAQSEVEVDVFVPALCASFAGGCDAIQGLLRMQVADSACVTEPGGDCTCAARQSTTLDDTDGYTIVGNEIVSSTLGRHWAYCVSGTTSLRYRDTSPTGMREPGIIQLGRR